VKRLLSSCLQKMCFLSFDLRELFFNLLMPEVHPVNILNTLPTSQEGLIDSMKKKRIVLVSKVIVYTENHMKHT
jgi:hypothetical protein